MKLKYLSAITLFVVSPLAFGQAGTCADPIPLQSNTTITGTTCGGQIGIDMGGVTLGHPSLVYSFTYEAPAAGDIIINGPNMGVFVGESCSSAPSLAGTSVNVGSLVDGQTYVAVVTTDPGIATTVPPTCDDFSGDIGTLPVTLQEFSVD